MKQRDDFPDPQEIVVPKANHYSFIALIPEVVAQSIPEIASDPEGFDRAAFHDVMNSTIVTFFKQALSDCMDLPSIETLLIFSSIPSQFMRHCLE